MKILNVFLSSTFRDLKARRRDIIEKLDTVFTGVGMEKFIPNGSSSQKVCIENLKKSDVVIFLISSYYGSLMDNCSLIESCKAICPMKKNETRISFTHCEYKTTIAEEIPHQTYLIEKGWDNIPQNIRKQALEFKEELGAEMWKGVEIPKKTNVEKINDIDDPSLPKMIGEHLAENIIKWYSQKKFNFSKFCNRRDELSEVINHINGKVEVYGVGGVGKTTLIQIALLIEKLRGRNIISIGVKQSYGTGSGYEYFKKKCTNAQHKVGGSKISLDDIINALSDYSTNIDEFKKKKPEESIQLISEIIRNENLLLFIDDFHLADETLQEFVQITDRVIMSSRKNTGIARKEICIVGMSETECLINLFCDSYDVSLPENIKSRIQEITEGHPVSTEILIRNYQKINFDKFENFTLKVANTKQVKEFYSRVIQDILSNDAYLLLDNLSVINTESETNIDREIIEESYSNNNIVDWLNELIDTGMFKKKEGKEYYYEFSYNHVKEALEDKSGIKSHEMAIKYYEKKRELKGEDINDRVEILHHKLKANYQDLNNQFQDIYSDIIEEPFQYGFRKLLDVGEELVKENKEAKILRSLGNLSQVIGKYNNAERYLLRASEIYQNLMIRDRDYYLEFYARNLRSLGNLYEKLKRFEKAEEILIETLEIRENIDKNKPQEENLYYLAILQLDVGGIHYELAKYQKAEFYYKCALNSYKKLSEIYNQKYLLEVSIVKNNLGLLYLDTGRFEDSEDMLLGALKIKKKLIKPDSEKYLATYAFSRSRIASLYIRLKQYEKAEKELNEAFQIRKELYKKSPDAVLSELTDDHTFLGLINIELNKYDKAKSFCLESLKLSQELVKKNPEAHLEVLANSKQTLGLLKSRLKEFEEAKNLLFEALEIFNNYKENYPERYIYDVATSNLFIGDNFKNSKDFLNAEKYYIEALENYENLEEKFPTAYLIEIAQTQNALGHLYILSKYFNKAKFHLFKALDTRKKLTKRFPNFLFSIDVAETLDNIGLLNMHSNKYKKAKKNFNQALDLDPINNNVFYNIARLESIRNNPTIALDHLRKAIELNKEWIDCAKNDEKFNNIRILKDFKDLIG